MIAQRFVINFNVVNYRPIDCSIGLLHKYFTVHDSGVVEEVKSDALGTIIASWLVNKLFLAHKSP